MASRLKPTAFQKDQISPLIEHPSLSLFLLVEVQLEVGNLASLYQGVKVAELVLREVSDREPVESRGAEHRSSEAIVLPRGKTSRAIRMMSFYDSLRDSGMLARLRQEDQRMTLVWEWSAPTNPNPPQHP